MPGLASPPVRARTILSSIVGVLMLLAIPLAALPAYGVLEMVARGHSLQNVDWLMGSVLCVLWLLVAAVAFLQKATGTAPLVIAGCLGLAIGFLGIVTHAGGAIANAGSSTGREHLFSWSLTLLPLLAGVGHIREARRRSATPFYVAAPLVLLIGVAASLR